MMWWLVPFGYIYLLKLRSTGCQPPKSKSLKLRGYILLAAHCPPTNKSLKSTNICAHSPPIVGICCLTLKPQRNNNDSKSLAPLTACSSDFPRAAANISFIPPKHGL